MPQSPIAITGIWLRSSGHGDIEVLVEREGKWRIVIQEVTGGPISHIVEPLGILNAPEESHPAAPRQKRPR